MPSAEAHPTPARPLSPQQAALRGLRTIIGALGSSARAIETRTGVTNAQLFLMQQLAKRDAVSIKELAAQARIGQSAVSIVVARLVRQGFVRRQPSLVDRRRVSVSLTTKGRALVRRAPQTATARVLEALSLLSSSDLRALARGIDALVDTLGIADHEPPMLFEHER